MTTTHQSHLIYLITGDEILLVEENADAIIKKARTSGYEERIIIDAEMPNAMDMFLSHRQNFSLFSTKKILEIRFKQKIAAAFAALITNACSALDSDQIILMRMPKIARAETQQKWYKAIEQKGRVITLWPLKGDNFLKWIQTRFQQFNLSTTREGFALIAANTEGNLLAASQLIEKLNLVYGSNNTNNSANINNNPNTNLSKQAPNLITDESIEKALSDHAHYDVFELCDAALNQNPAHCLKILFNLKNQGSEPAIILWALMQDVRKLAALFIASPNERAGVYQKQGIWSTRQALFQKALRVFNQNILNKLIALAKNADALIKGVNTGNVWLVLEDFCLILSGVIR